MITVTVMTVIFLIFMGVASAYGQEQEHVTIKAGIHFHDYCTLLSEGITLSNDCVLDTNSSLPIETIHCVVTEMTGHACMEVKEINSKSCIPGYVYDNRTGFCVPGYIPNDYPKIAPGAPLCTKECENSEWWTGILTV